MLLTDNFAKWEFESKDGSLMPTRVLENIQELSKNLQVVRDYLSEKYQTNVRIKILSGYRSEFHNQKVGGRSRSQHLKGKASDIHAYGVVSNKELFETIDMLMREGCIKKGGLSLYSWGVHYDIRGWLARW